jgi:quinolinate synthase
MPHSFPAIEEMALSATQVSALREEIGALAQHRGAVILAHNYQRPEVQDVADFVGDSLGLARKAATTDARVIVFCGVHFMAETAAILSPEKRVLLPDLRAGCSLAESITADELRRWKAEFPDYAVVGYVNTTASVKAELDYCCTSSNALAVVDAIPVDQGILFLPDFFLGAYLKVKRSDRRIEVWMGECHVHKEIRAQTVNRRRREHPEAEVLIHPECGCASQILYEMGLGDVEGEGVHIASTEGMIRLAESRPAATYIVATEVGILHRMRQVAPSKRFVAADPEAVCPYMKTITLEHVRNALLYDEYRVTVPADIARKARSALDRMIGIS